MSSSNFILEVDPACGEIPQAWREDVIPRMAGAMKEGARGMLYRTRAGERVTYYLHRRDLVSLLLTMDPEAAPVAPRENAWGPALWAVLHEAPYKVSRIDWPAYLDSFAKRVPCGECRQHWRALVRDSPPDLSTPDAFYRWTVEAHNRVNARLGKPQWTD